MCPHANCSPSACWYPLGCDPQVKGHVAANLHVGNTRAKLIDVLTQLLPLIGYPRTLNGLRAVDEITLPESKRA